MIIVFYGQPHSGKTTLAEALQEDIFLSIGEHVPIIDGDEIREIFQNKDFSTEGRLRNLARISDIATFLATKYPLAIVSAVYPMQAARDYLNSIHGNTYWIELSYYKPRGREKFHVEHFDNYVVTTNNKHLKVNTDEGDIKYCIDKVNDFIDNWFSNNYKENGQ